MSDDAYLQLERRVQAIIDPLRAGARRKSIMREELLAHLAAIYEDERDRARCADHALAGTLRRFGDSSQLTNDLQASVPALERFISMIYNPEQGMKRFWLTLILAGIAGLAFGLSLVLPALAKYKLHGHLEGGPLVFLVLGVVIMVLGAQVSCWGIARKMRQTA
jgi:hypothetical protein